VGEGPFPTEIPGEAGERLREAGGEYGATTGRPRRCGWLDAVALRYAAAINGVAGVAITKLDVLDSQPAVKICTSYRHNDQALDAFPSDLRVLERCEPQFEELEGWQTDTTQAKNMDELPAKARAYLRRVSQLLGVPVQIVSVGHDRCQTIFANPGGLFR
jgi:adenylosuccinate synthase